MRVATMAAGLVLVLAACGGEKKAPEAPAAAAPAPEAAAPATPAPDAAAPAATGASVDVNMELDGTNYVYKPASLTVKAGDVIKFHNKSGGPHNVAFDPATIPADSKAQLDANMDGKLAELSSPMLQNPDEKYTISFGGVKPGVYPFHCTPHLAMGMKGTITVQ